LHLRGHGTCDVRCYQSTGAHTAGFLVQLHYSSGSKAEQQNTGFGCFEDSICPQWSPSQRNVSLGS
jgi:hypothetical protein